MKRRIILSAYLFMGFFHAASAQTPGNLDLSFNSGADLRVHNGISVYTDVPAGDGKAQIPSDSADPNPGNLIDFGEIVTLGSTVSRTFTIRNDEAAVFSVGEVSVDGVQAADFTIAAQPETAVAPEESTTFQITIDPSAIGLRSASVSFEDNDSGSPFSFAIQGTGTTIPQSIDTSDFDNRPRRVTDGPFPLGASASSGLPLTYEVLAGPVTVDASGLVTPTGPSGAVTIRISQQGGGDYGPADDVYVTFILRGWDSFTKLVAGWGTYALRADGTLWTWGYANNAGQLADDTIEGTGRVAPQQIGSASDWTELAIGNNCGFGIRAGGTLWAWGGNLSGQLGDGTTTVRTAPVQIGSERAWAAISTGNSHTAAVAADGTLWTWGSNTNGKLGHGDTVRRTSPTQVGAGNDWSRVECGTSLTLATKTNGELWAWGYSSYGQLGLGDTDQRTSPTRVGTATDWEHIAIGNPHVLALKTNGTLWAWGANHIGQFGNGSTSPSLIPVQVGTGSDWTAISANFDSSTSAARKADGSIWVWGSNYNGQFGNGTTITRSTPQRFALGTDWSGIQVGLLHVVAWREDGTVWVAGDGWGFSGAGPRALTRTNGPAQEWLQLSGNGTHFHALRADGTLWAWGRNGGTFGNGSTADAAVTTQIGTEDQWEHVASGGQTSGTGAFTLAVKKDGTLWGAGSNINFKLGLGDPFNRPVFTQIGVATTWKRAATGFNHGMAVRTDGSLWGWGSNDNGQLGLGDTTARTTPTQVGSDTDWQTVACAVSHSMGIKTNGTLWAFGLNANGRLGLGDTIQRTTPTQVGSGTDWVAVECGLSHTLALKNDGTLWVWGVNSSGQLGLGDTEQRMSPVEVGMGFHWTDVSASINSSAALTADGTLWTSGENSLGQLGLGTTTNLLAFTQTGTASFQHAAVGAVSLAAIQRDGSFWTAGTAAPQVLGGGRDRTAVLPVLPQLSPQNIVPPIEGDLSARVTSTSGLPVTLALLSGTAEIDGDEITHTGPRGSTVTFLAWQPGDERAWNAAPPLQLSITQPAGDICVFAGTVDGVKLSTGESTVAFETAAVGNVPVTRIFTIRNGGNEALGLGEVVATGDWSADTTGMADTLAPGATTSFIAVFAPTSSGPRVGGIIITSDDPDEAEFSVSFTGHGLLPQNVSFTDGIANLPPREILTGDGHVYNFTLSGPRFVSLSTTGGALLRAELRDGEGNLIASFDGDSDFEIDKLLPAGDYTLRVFRENDMEGPQSYALTLDASEVAFVAPYVNTVASIVSKKAKTVTGPASVGNAGNLPDILVVRATGGSGLFKVSYFDASGNVTAALLSGLHRTPELVSGDTPAAMRAVITPNKKKLTKKKGTRTKILKKSITLSIQATATFDPTVSDASTIRVQTK